MKRLYRKYRQLVFSAAVALLIIGIFYVAENLLDSMPTDIAGEISSLPTIILDPGHGGMDGGCVAVNGIPEKGINLTIATEVRDILTALGYDVVMTRDRDISIHDKGIEGIANQKKSDMDNRLKLINSYENAVAVSIHQNQFTDPQYSGAQMFYSDSDPLSQQLAQTFQSKFVQNLQPDNTREIKQVGDELFLLYYSNCPMVMAECGFLSNPEESERLQNEEYQKQVAFTIASAVIEFVNDNY